VRPLGATLVLLALAASTAAGAQEAYVDSGIRHAPQPFVRAIGDHFVREGGVFRFVGANVAVVHGQAHRAALAATLDAARGDGLEVIRVWALGEREAASPDWTRAYAFRIGEDGWVEESFVHLDHVLAEARMRRLSVIVVLANRWGDYGGVPQYLRWAGEPFTAAPDGVARTELGTFFRSERARSLYLAHVERIVSRTNTVTGVAYRDDPTIFAWELMNEISCERRDAADLASFVSSSARRIHALDPHHLVSAGHIGYVTAAERRTWREIVGLPEIDYADAHAYPIDHDRTRTVAELDAFVDDHAMLAHQRLHRPLVLGEVGFPIGRRALGLRRAALFDHFLDHADQAGVDGSIAWMYATIADPVGAHTIAIDARRDRSVRDVLAERARAIGQWTVEPSWPAGDAPLWDPSHTIEGTHRVARSRGDNVTIAPDAFADARFEVVGRYDGGAIAHVYGGDHGWVEYHFRAPREISAALTISMRASSELPGRGEGAHADDGSTVRISIDGHAIGSIAVPPDDGLGRQVTLDATLDEVTQAAIAEPRVHTLRLEVDDDDAAHGLCLYGAATGHEPLDEAITAELPGRIELSFPP
jgi:mannan endo-1,4-beta-mannosidase